MCIFRYLDRIIRSSELVEFSALLQQQQKALTADGRLLSDLYFTVGMIASNYLIEDLIKFVIKYKQEYFLIC